MKVVTIILGVLLAILGIVCIFSPGSTFLATGYLLAILLLVYGIIGIINVARKYSSPISLFASIPAVIIGVIAVFFPGSAEAFDILLLYLFAAWLVVQGIVNIIMSIRTRIFNRAWVFELILGIISVIVGGYSFAHPQISAFAIGILVGIYLIEIGISMIVIAAAARNIEDAVDEIGGVIRNVGPRFYNKGAEAEEAAEEAATEAANGAAEAANNATEAASEAANNAAEAVSDAVEAPKDENKEA